MATGQSDTQKLTIFGMAMLNVGAVMTLRGLPMMAKEGFTMFFYLLFASLLFLVPVSLIAAELATAWPNGGVYRWVSEAYGKRWGFVAIWLQWVQNVIWYPIQLAFAAAALAYIFNDAPLAGNNYFIFAVIIAVYWLATLINFRGIKSASKVASLGVVSGVLFPTLLLVIFGLIWVFTGNPIQILTTPGGGAPTINLLPDFGNMASIAFLAGNVLLFAGIEVNAVHVNDLEKPKAQYPQGVFLAMLIIMVVFTLGSFSIATVLPATSISLSAGVLQAFEDILKVFHFHWLMPLISFLVFFGATAGVMVWLPGPSKGMLAVAREGALPPALQKVNKAGVQVPILLVQGGFVTLLSSMYLVMSNVSTAFFFLTALTAILYLIMYFLLFASVIKLRYSRPDAKRIFKIPGGMAGIWSLAGIGILAVLFAIIVGFLPPSQLPIDSPSLYMMFLVAGTVVFVGLPLLIWMLRKPSWDQGVKSSPDGAE